MYKNIFQTKKKFFFKSISLNKKIDIVFESLKSIKSSQ